MKRIRLNVDIYFEVPDDYVVNDTESIEFVGDVELHGNGGEVLATKVVDHATLFSSEVADN